MRQGYNPILPLEEYIPDGEPHVFGERIYLFGSHDTEGGNRYCAEENYVGWSAPLDNPTEWRYEGEIYSAKQDPSYQEGKFNDLYAPDVVKGNDGRFYLYYCFGGAEGHNKVNVAVCDTPVGRYEYLGFVRNPDGTVHCEYLMGDPAVINDNGTIRLYMGWSLSMVAAGAHRRGDGFEGEVAERQEIQSTAESTARPVMPQPGDPEMNRKMAPVYQMLFHRSFEQVADLEYPLMGANTIELCEDMLTVKGKMNRIVPGQFDTPEDSSFYGHAFYEASSIRKINGTYYFIYSSENSNELCYAISAYPDRDFVYGGTIISNGDVGYHGLKSEDRQNMTANDHGSLECINGQWYIFHHRQTHKSTFSRQACAEPVEILPDGSILQVECTSMGLNGGPLLPEGEFPAVISCVLTNGKMPHITNTKIEDDIPYITHEGEERFITGITNGTRIGYKYFAFSGCYRLSMRVRGKGAGHFLLLNEKEVLGKIAIEPSENWTDAATELEVNGTEALYFCYEGEGRVDFLSFSFDLKEPEKQQNE